MALDEALLEAMPRLGQPVLRFYGWTEPAASFGYFQKFAEVERAMPLRPLVRRPTGGGIVPHGADWTYSLAFPPGHEWYLLRAEESYRRVHEWIQAVFARLNIPTELAPRARGSRLEETPTQIQNLKSEIRNDQSVLTSAATVVPAGQCFAGHEKFDLLWRGKKIAGAAQRRTRAGLLIQGSVQPPPLSLTRMNWQQAMCDAVRALWVELRPDSALWERAEELAATKYSQTTYTRKR